jgi:hypothetical protein
MAVTPVTTIPTPVEPLADGSGQVTPVWRAWIQSIQSRMAAFLVSPTFTGDPTFLGDPTFSGDPLFTGDPTFSNNPTFSGDPLFSGNPFFTGDPTRFTPPPGDNDTSIATTEFVTRAVASEASTRASADATLTDQLTALTARVAALEAAG